MEATRKDSIYRLFVLDLDAAEAAAEVQAVVHWRAAMPKDWKSAEQWLKARQPERWAPKVDGQPQVGAFAGVNLTLNTGGGGVLASSAAVSQGQSLESLLEENPGLINATMQTLDQFLPLSEGTGELTPETYAADLEVRRLEAQNAPDEVIEAEDGSWTAIDGEENTDF
jgi:hypothetical protein